MDNRSIFKGQIDDVLKRSGIQEDGELNATVAERVTLTAARRIETTA